MQFSGNKAEKKGSGQSADKSENKAEIVIHTRVTGIRGILDRQVVFTLSRFIFPHKNALRRMEMQSHFCMKNGPGKFSSYPICDRF